LQSSLCPGADPTTLSKDDKLAMLKALHARLGKLQSTLTQHEERVAAAAAAKDGALKEPSNSDQENDNGAVNAAVAPAAAAAAAATTKGGARQIKRKSAGSDAPLKSKGAARGNGRGKKSTTYESDEEMEDAAEVEAAVQAAAAVDIDTLMAMGFGKRQAKDALEEAEGSVEMAAEWLMTHCM